MDYKQVGGGAAAGGGLMALVLALFQQQGVGLVADRYKADIKIAIEKSIENSKRVDRLESRIDNGFNEVKTQVGKVADIVRENTRDRYTRDDHESYARSIEARFERIEDQIIFIKSEVLRRRQDK